MTYRPGTYRNHQEELSALMENYNSCNPQPIEGGGTMLTVKIKIPRTFAEAIVDAPERDNDQWLADLEDTGRGLAVMTATGLARLAGPGAVYSGAQADSRRRSGRILRMFI